jgi:hypothetical protein
MMARAALLLALAGPQEPAWKDLFNGRDLEGWAAVGSAKWKVEDGVLVGGQDGDPKRSGVLHTREAYRDFELSFEFMIDEHGKYNSGLFIRNDAGKSGQSTYQINIGRAEAGEFTGGVVVHRDRKVLWLAKGDEKDEVRKKLEWNSMKVLARGAHVEVELNGKKVSDCTDPAPPPRFLEKGVLAFQTYGAEGHAGWIKLRNLRIRELK